MTIKSSDLWEQVLNILEGKISRENLQTWIKPIKCTEFSDNKIKLLVTNKHHRDWITSHFLSEIKNTLQELTAEPMEIQLQINSLPSLVNESVTKPHKSIEASKESLSSSIIKSTLNPKYTFDTFVIGGSTRLAHAAALAVSENPAKSYNPLFLYGGVGLGKTHLLHAIGHAAQKNGKFMQILYTSAEQFMNAFITAVTQSRRQDFQAIYRNIDILMIDDIHFLAGKEGTQEEFFHTFNALHSAHKQIVVSSDRPPKEIPTLQERLLSRFEWGLIADIQPPDLETRMAILQKKAALERIHLPNEVTYYIADNIQSNIRQLEGCLIRIAASASLTGYEITLDTAKRVLQGILDEKKEKKFDVLYIQQAVVNYYKISMDELIGKRRSKGVVEPRQVAMYLCRKLTKNSFPEIGMAFGQRDHTTVMHACNKVERGLEIDANFRRVVLHLEEQIKN